MFRPLHYILQRSVCAGHLIVHDSSGVAHHFGNGSGRHITIRIQDRATERAVAFDPALAVGEAYMDGRLIIESGSLYDFIELLLRNHADLRLPPWAKSLEGARQATRRLMQFNPSARARRNVAHHYDIEREVYDLFLDADRQYSCAYFTPGADLIEAQHAKKRHIAAKLAVEPHHRVLDIGSGWGGLALYLADATGAEVKGITLSTEQIKIARERARSRGLDRAVTFDLEDYRHVSGSFDRITSVGMLEHVGVNHYARYFGQIARLLRDDGVALIHSIGRSDGPGHTNPFISKYIFPGGYFPALSEVLPVIERAGLIVNDVEILRFHYAETLKAWRERFLAQRDRAVALKGEAFCRMWEFYLAGSEAAFRMQGLMVFQVQLTKRLDVLPIIRDYMLDTERRLARGSRPFQRPELLAGE
jgi:cyclopropane-fatty-acyl-phospholipid synthase